MTHDLRAISVIVPAHNEDQYLGACLESLRVAAAHPRLANVDVSVVVVLDHCDDDSLPIAEQAGATCLELKARNVGAARDAGARLALARGTNWLAFTDADTVVAPDWLAAQHYLVECDLCDAICGVVDVDDWADYSMEVRAEYASRYTSQDGHRHIHGANLALSSDAYLRAGGFQPLTCHEDVTLVRKMEDLGMRISWSAMPTVRTSSRRVARVQGGFSDFLKSLESVVPAGLSAAASAVVASSPIAILNAGLPPHSPDTGLAQAVGLALGLNASPAATGLIAPSGA